jgi:hypothetical protein
MSQPRLDFYFAGEAFWKEFDKQYKEYRHKPGSRFNVLSDGDKHFVQFVDKDGNGGTPINMSQNCPGAPDCP